MVEGEGVGATNARCLLQGSGGQRAGSGVVGLAFHEDARQVCGERLRELGHELRRPEADLLRNGIYELRVGREGLNYRILYFFHGRVAAVLAHGLIKEREVPSKDIDRALERKRLFEQDPKGHTYREG